MHDIIRNYVKAVIRESAFISTDEVDHIDLETNDEKKALKFFMQKLNLQIIPSGENHDGILGRGANGVVIDVIQKNKNFALKITGSTVDFDAYSSLKSIYDQIPNFVRRSLPVIYAQETLVNSGQYGMSFFGGTLMEKLIKPPQSLLKAGWSQYSIDAGFEEEAPEFFDILRKKKIDFLNSIENFLFEIIKKSKKANKLEIYNQILSSSLFNQLIKEEINNLTKSTKTNARYVDRLFFNKIKLRSVVHSLTATSDFDVSDYDYDDIFKELGELFKNQTRISSFPVNSSDDQQGELPLDPRIKHLVISLRWLSKKGLVDWGDVHNDNVMYRPSTKDLVVADVGLFHF